MNPALPVAAAVFVAGVAARPWVAPRRLAAANRPAGPPRLGGIGPHPRRRGTASGPDAVARWCDDLARSCRTGSALAAAVRQVAAPPALAATIEPVHLALDRGVPLATALDAAVADRHTRLAFTVLRACAEHGGPPAEPLDRAAATLRGRAADLAERRTHSAQARLSAVVMTWLPLVMLGLLVTTSGSVRAVVSRPVGVAVIATGLALNVAGWRWMRRITGATGSDA